MRLRLLGTVEAVDGRRSFPARDPLQRGLLTLLAIQANHHVGAEALAAALWKRPPHTALRQIQIKVRQLRELMDRAHPENDQRKPKLIDQPGGYLLFIDPSSIDLTRFETYTAEARRATSTGEFERASERYRQALALWRGAWLAGTPLTDDTAPGIRAEAIKLHDLRISATEERIGTELVLGHGSELVAELKALVRNHPLRERLRLHLIRALGQAGMREEALEAYQEGRRLLQQEHGLELSPDLNEAYQLVLSGRPARSARAVPSPRKPQLAGSTLTRPDTRKLVATKRNVHRGQLCRTQPVVSAQRGAPAFPATQRTAENLEPSGPHAGPPAHLQPILEQLLIGATDLTASRHLGLSPRTFSRRVSELLEYLEVDTRFQAGVLAQSRGWITK